MLALHYLSAYELARATGGDTRELSDRARLSLREAGGGALSLNAFPAAERYFRAASTSGLSTISNCRRCYLRLGQARYYATPRARMSSRMQSACPSPPAIKSPLPRLRRSSLISRISAASRWTSCSSMLSARWRSSRTVSSRA